MHMKSTRILWRLLWYQTSWVASMKTCFNDPKTKLVQFYFIAMPVILITEIPEHFKVKNGTILKCNFAHYLPVSGSGKCLEWVQGAQWAQVQPKDPNECLPREACASAKLKQVDASTLRKSGTAALWSTGYHKLMQISSSTRRRSTSHWQQSTKLLESASVRRSKDERTKCWALSAKSGKATRPMSTWIAR